VAGAGSRGAGYAAFALEHPDRAAVVAVAEPRNHYRNTLAERHAIPDANVFTDWRDMAAQPKLADAVVIATQDAMHVEPALAFAEKGYDMLLEKPMAPDADGCRRIVDTVKTRGVIFAVGHVMRYTRYTELLTRLIRGGRIGDVVGIQHLEGVGYWHQAHSFVRGNWRNTRESSFMLLAKSCHDLDWIRHLVGARCEAVASFGSLKHFRPEEKPAGAADRCLDCNVEPRCPYSAKKIYLGRVARGQTGWPVNILTPDPTETSVLEALRTGPYGRCVYECDNDVVDNQVVSMRFEGGRSAVFTMTAFGASGRKTRIFGTRGELYGDGSRVHVYDFLTDETEELDVEASEDSVLGGHGGGDYGLMSRFVRAVSEQDPDVIMSGPDETLETHLMVFAAERARLEDRVVRLHEESAAAS
jgi:predicted dehydrogenase